MLVQFVRDFSERQSQLFLSDQHVPGRLPAARSCSRSIDDDVAEADAALAATFETAARGVIYEHRPASLPAERLVAALKPVLAEAGRGGGSAFERDAAVVLRRVGEAAREMRAGDPGNRRAFLELLGRVIRTGDARAPAAEPPARPPLDRPVKRCA